MCDYAPCTPICAQSHLVRGFSAELLVVEEHLSKSLLGLGLRPGVSFDLPACLSVVMSPQRGRGAKVGGLRAPSCTSSSSAASLWKISQLFKSLTESGVADEQCWQSSTPCGFCWVHTLLTADGDGRWLMSGTSFGTTESSITLEKCRQLLH